MKNIKDFLKERCGFVLVFLVLNFCLFYYNVLRDDILHRQYLWPLAILQIIVEIGLIAIYAFVRKKNWKIERLFLIVFIPLGLTHAVITPFNQAPDEINHIFRADAISEGKLIAQQDEEGEYREGISRIFWDILNNAQPDRLYYKKVKNRLLEKTYDDDWTWEYSPTVSYNPIAYAPQAAGLAVGKFFRLPIVLTMYLGRIFIVLAVAVFGYFAIKMMPRYKEFIVFIFMLPATIQQSAIFSGDGMLFASSMLLIAHAFNCIYSKQKSITKMQILLIYVLTIILANCKSVVYFPIALLFLLIPKEKFNKPIWKYIHIMSAMVIAFTSSLAWSLSQGVTVGGTNTNLEFAMQNPFVTMITAIGTMFSADTVQLLERVHGLQLGYFNYRGAEIYFIIFIVLAVVLLVKNVEYFTVKRYEKVLYWSIPIVVSGLLYAVAFIQWGFSKPEDYVIDGVQGRYFTPLLPLIPFMIHPSKPEKTRKPLNIDYVFLFGIFANSCILASKFLHNF